MSHPTQTATVAPVVATCQFCLLPIVLDCIPKVACADGTVSADGAALGKVAILHLRFGCTGVNR